MKMAVLYYTKTGNTRQMAEVIVQGMQRVEGVQAKAFPIDGADAAWVQESRCVVLGSPIYMSNVAGAVKSWLETGAGTLNLPGKLGGAFATADYLHGGGELGIRLMLDHLMVFGMLTYSGGGALGRPVIHLGPVALKDHLDESSETFALYGQRMAAKAVELFS